jgi:uncharacterized membrane protein YdcZ (DUF606 family)
VKFVLVAGEFMHLKFDTPLFKRLFVVGAILAGFCYTAVLTAMGALETPRAVIPVHWWIFLVGSVAAIVIWVIPRKGTSIDTDEHTAGHADQADHGHAAAH